MSNPPTYSFLPWLRSGVANSIAQADGDTGVKVRASLPLDVTLTGTNLDGSDNSQVVHRDISLYGPGEIVGIESKAVVKVDPRNWITNFEPNYLPYIEFYDEDFPWRYTPAAANFAANRLRPWITLIVLKESEFSDGKNISGKPLPYFELQAGINAANVFPHPSELWAWAHVHANVDLSNNGDRSIPQVLQKLQDTLNQNRDLAYSRLICPRRLEPDTAYHAFVVPTFETGRLAGLGQDIPDTTVATASAWDNHQTQFPYYYRWYFQAGDFGDFEYLVKLLQPQPVDKRVGVRDMDVLHPLSNLPPIDTPVDLGGVLKLGGALRVPFDTMTKADQDEVNKFDRWDVPYPHRFEEAIAKLINLADDYSGNQPSAVNPDGDPDPVVTSPLYGRWPALVDRVLRAADGSLLTNNQNWVHRLNLDPRFRVAAGFGTEVVQANDQQYMEAAWQQVGDVLAANNRLRLAQMAQAASISLYQRHLLTATTERQFLLTAPVQSRVMGSPTTVAAQVRASVVPSAVTSGVFRRVTRQGTALMSRLALPSTSPGQIVARINAEELHPSPPKVAPPKAIKINDADNAIQPTGEPSSVESLLESSPWLRFLPFVILILALVFAFLVLGPTIAVAVAVVGAPLAWITYSKLSKWAKAAQAEGSIREEKETPASVDQLPKVSNFVITRPGTSFVPQAGGADSIEAAKFKTALRDVYAFTSIKFPVTAKPRLQLENLAATTVAAINPVLTVPRRLKQIVYLPDWLLGNFVEQFTPVMAYPVIDIPMYKPLSDISSELFLPNINLIPNNSMTLLESNQRFIEAYMVGLNHEMARELLWNEYPTDQRGSYFRQFWDVSLMLPPGATQADKEKYRDIPELHKWPASSGLGTHNYREQNGAQALLVLVIRGELLKRYPTTVIYAQKAQWQLDKQGNVDTGKDRVLVEILQGEEDSPPDSKVRLPLFEAKVDPDIYFIGFDLDAAEARGSNAADDPGWFFVLKERPGEPRFGMQDLPPGTTQRLINWNDLAWDDLSVPAGGLIRLTGNLSFDTYNAGVDLEDKPDPADAQATWTPSTDAAELAYILYRVPVLVAVHASRMLPPKS
jgi:hypothetical protein